LTGILAGKNFYFHTRKYLVAVLKIVPRRLPNNYLGSDPFFSGTLKIASFQNTRRDAANIASAACLPPYANQTLADVYAHACRYIYDHWQDASWRNFTPKNLIATWHFSPFFVGSFPIHI
jgi:hypothetical protein